MGNVNSSLESSNSSDVIEGNEDDLLVLLLFTLRHINRYYDDEIAYIYIL